MKHSEFQIIRHHIAAEVAKSEHSECGVKFAALKPEWLIAEFCYFDNDVFDVIEDLEDSGLIDSFRHPSFPDRICFITRRFL